MTMALIFPENDIRQRQRFFFIIPPSNFKLFIMAQISIMALVPKQQKTPTLSVDRRLLVARYRNMRNLKNT